MLKELVEYAEKSNDTITVEEAVKVTLGSLVEMAEHTSTFDCVKEKLTVNEYEQLMSRMLCSVAATIIAESKKTDDEVKEFCDYLHLDYKSFEKFKKKFYQA